MQYVTFTGSKVIRNSGALWKGHLLHAASGDSVVEIYDGLSDAGVLVATIKIKNGEHDEHVHSGIPLDVGIYAKLVSGSVTGSFLVE